VATANALCGSENLLDRRPEPHIDFQGSPHGLANLRVEPVVEELAGDADGQPKERLIHRL